MLAPNINQLTQNNSSPLSGGPQGIECLVELITGDPRGGFKFLEYDPDLGRHATSVSMAVSAMNLQSE
jgi:hypothetical protein